MTGARNWIPVLFIIIFVYIWGVTHLKVDSIYDSELRSIIHTGFTLDADHNAVDVVNSVFAKSAEHGPLYFIILNEWAKITGFDLATLRLLSVFLGMLTVAALYRLTCKLTDHRIGLLAVIFLAGSAYFTYYIHEVRMYTLLPLFAIGVVYYYLGVTTSKAPHWLTWLGLYISTAFIIYIHYFGMVVLIGIAIYHLIVYPKNKTWFKVIGVAMCSILTVAPLLFIFSQSAVGFDAGDIDYVPHIDYFLTLLFINANGIWWLILAAIVMLVLNFTKLSQKEKFIFILFIVMLAFTVSVNFFMPHVVKYRRLRYALILAPFLSIITSIAIYQLHRMKGLPYLVVCMWMVMFCWYNGSNELKFFTNVASKNADEFPPYHEIIWNDDVHVENEPIISLHPSNFINEIIIKYNEKVIGSEITNIVDNVSLTNPVGNSYIRRAERYREEEPLIFILYDPQVTSFEEQETFADLFAPYYRSCKTLVDKPSARLDEYLHNDIPCDLVTGDQSKTIRYDNGMVLENTVDEINNGELIIYMRWANLRPHNYGASIQIFNDENAKIHQIDHVITEHSVQIEKIDLSQIPAGNYVAKLIVYDATTIKSQSGIIIDTQQPFERELDIFTFEIE